MRKRETQLPRSPDGHRGAILHDGVLVERRDDDGPAFPERLLRSWEDAVHAETGMAIRLEVKPLEAPTEWLYSQPRVRGRRRGVRGR